MKLIKFLFKGRNDVTISQTGEFLIPVYLALFVHVILLLELAFIPSLLAMVFAIKIWCQFHPHSFYQSVKRTCTTFTIKGVCPVGG